MLRKSGNQRSVALLATGDEICNGDIINTNSQEIAKLLVQNQIKVGKHVISGDNIDDIYSSLAFLANDYDAIIITGGLGPTSDDLTRYALARILQVELEFDEDVWQGISARLQKFGYPSPPESNRQQALFPRNSVVIPNPHGTAAGCYVADNNKIYFMLPGPPYECLPMMSSVVIPVLKDMNFSETSYNHKWLLFKVSEGKIAEELDEMVSEFNAVTGYRLAYPYLEFKIQANDEATYNSLVPKLDQFLDKHMFSATPYRASELLKKVLISSEQTLSIQDECTGGVLEMMLHTPNTHSKIFFTHKPSDALPVKITGLQVYWNSLKEQHETEIQIETPTKTFKETIPFRDERIKVYAAEVACMQILEILKISTKDKNYITSHGLD